MYKILHLSDVLESSFHRLTSTECTLHKPYDYVRTDDDNSNSSKKRQRIREWRHTKSEMADLHGIEGFVPMIDPEAKGIILV